ncbi:MAG: radical SAM protein [Ignavibacteria bacterium]
MILLINPRATNWKARIPLSVLSIGASLEGIHPYHILDGNLDPHLVDSVLTAVRQQQIKYVGITVMPGPQLVQAIHLTKAIKRASSQTVVIWGGYFPTLHAEVVIISGYVDYVIRDQGDYAFRALIDALETNSPLDNIKGLSYNAASPKHNEPQGIIDPNSLPLLPYHRVELQRYIGRTYLGTRTVNYHSSVGCPFLCGFCAVAASYKARWLGLDAARIVNDLIWYKNQFGVNAVEFHDNNFFTSEKRTYEFADRIRGQGIAWWGEARPDTMLQYADATWRLMQQSGCKMIFFGAESSSQSVLDLMKKGGTQTPDTTLELVTKMKEVGIVPELSFVLGNPTDNPERDIEEDIAYIRNVKQLNPDAEIIIYIYSPVFFDEAELFQSARAYGFAYPRRLDDWLLPEWQLHDLRKRPVTPWLSDRAIRRVKNFERVIHAAFPTLSDLHLTRFHRATLRLFGRWRYSLSFYNAPYEVAAVQRLFRYRHPEIEGF